MATSKQLDKFLSSLEPAIRQAFLEDIAASKYRANIGQLEAAIAAGNIEAVLFAAGVRENQWATLIESLRGTYKESGAFAISTDVPARYGMRFDVTNPRAQRLIEQQSSQLIVEINGAQIETIQKTISAGFVDGRNPRSIALDIVGRVSQQTGRRDGGVIGLHQQFSEAVTRARQELNALDANYFNRTRRDMRFDSTVRQAIESSKAIPANIIDRITTRYEDRLLQTRATNIARTEALSSMNAASHEAMNQVVQEGLADADAITEIWDATADSRSRIDHIQADGQSIRHGEVFSVGGYQMRYPGDTGLGAGASQTINCRCHIRRKIDFSRTRL
jgi:hypothetical protein